MMQPSPRDQMRDAIDAMREWLGFPFVLVGFLIHVFGVGFACIGCLITDGVNGAKKFWTEYI